MTVNILKTQANWKNNLHLLYQSPWIPAVADCLQGHHTVTDIHIYAQMYPAAAHVSM